jgi:hypothetical protein
MKQPRQREGAAGACARVRRPGCFFFHQPSFPAWRGRFLLRRFLQIQSNGLQSFPAPLGQCASAAALDIAFCRVPKNN